MGETVRVCCDYGSGEVEHLLGLTRRQLAYWATTGVVEPKEIRGSGTGKRMRFAYEDLVRLAVIKRLLDAGMSLQAIRRDVAFLRALPRTGGPLGDIFLTSDDRSIHAYLGSERVLEALRGGQMVVALGLEGIVRGLDARLIERRAVGRGAALESGRDAVAHEVR